MKIGYTAGVYDLFHIGHLRLLQRAKAMCDRLIVGVSTDELVRSIKQHNPAIPFTERIEVVSGAKPVDIAIPQYSYDKYEAWEKLKFDVLFIGDDHYGDKHYTEFDKKLKKQGVDIIYLPYTVSISSTILLKKFQ